MIRSDKLSVGGTAATIGFALLTLPACSDGQAVVDSQPKSLASGAHPEEAPYKEFTGSLVAVTPDVLREEKLPKKPIGLVFQMDEYSYLEYQRRQAQGEVKGAGDLLTVALSSEPNLPRAGVLDHFDDKFDPATGTIAVYGVLPNDEDLLLPGMYVRVRMTFGPPSSN